jgi:hypothetical protein
VALEDPSIYPRKLLSMVIVGFSQENQVCLGLNAWLDGGLLPVSLSPSYPDPTLHS